MAQVTIGYSALASRVQNIVFPQLQFPHEILISVQNPNSVKYVAPSSEFKVTVIESKETGVTKSRNAVIESTTTEYLVFADDDATINPDGLIQILDFLEANPQCDLVTAITTNEKGVARKRYAPRKQKLTVFNSAKVGTIEMVLRVRSAQSRGVRFDGNFGAGSPNPLGDEYIFVCDLLRAGGQGVFLPIKLATHPDESSGSNGAPLESEETLSARAKVFTRVFGWKAPVVRALFYLRHKRSGKNFIQLLRFIRG